MAVPSFYYIKRKLRLSDRKCLVLIVVFILTIYWLSSSSSSNGDGYGKDANRNSNVNFVKLNNDFEIGNQSAFDERRVYAYNKYLPIVFIGGVPRSGTTLMRAVLDAHPQIRCGEETRVLPRILSMHGQWLASAKEKERLTNAGVTEDVLDEAIASFMLEIIVKHGKPADMLCNKDPLVLRYSNYVQKLFPNAKFLLMVRDARATVHSIISRKVTITGFNLNSYPECFKRWNTIMESMFSQCVAIGEDKCMPVYYEQLILHPEVQIRKILNFLNMGWNDAVLNHEKYIGDEISLSKLERSSDQVIKPINLEALSKWVGVIPDQALEDIDNLAPMLSRLGYDTKSKNPNYGEADAKIKENTELIQANKDYWLQLAKKYSVHVVESI